MSRLIHSFIYSLVARVIFLLFLMLLKFTWSIENIIKQIACDITLITLLMNRLTVCSYHVTYAFQSESTLYSCLNVQELLARSRREF